MGMSPQSVASFFCSFSSLPGLQSEEISSDQGEINRSDDTLRGSLLEKTSSFVLNSSLSARQLIALSDPNCFLSPAKPKKRDRRNHKSADIQISKRGRISSP